MKWASFKCIFWNANDSAVKLMVFITSDISLQYRPCYKNMLNYDSDNKYDNMKIYDNIKIYFPWL